jgi:ATP-dependent DNA ligase
MPSSTFLTPAWEILKPLGLTAEKMKECVWLKPEAVAQIEFLEWTGANHLRHTKFVALRNDKEPREVVRET